MVKRYSKQTNNDNIITLVKYLVNLIYFIYYKGNSYIFYSHFPGGVSFIRRKTKKESKPTFCLTYNHGRG